jgi:hypothetical protein
MATTRKSDPQNLLSQQPGSGRPAVSLPEQVLPTTPSQQPLAQAATRPRRAVKHPVAPSASSYVDSLLFTEGIYQNQQDYDQTVADAVARIVSGQIQPRQPDLNEPETH